MLIAVGSANPAKIAAVQAGFHDYNCRVVPVSVSSLVSDQPSSDEETIMGAVNRAKNALASADADMGIGLEGGVHKTEQGLFLCNWGALIVHGEKPIIAGGARILLPGDIADKIGEGMELGPVMEKFTKRQNVRKQEGAVGIFTNGRIDRKGMFSHIVELLVGQYEYQGKDRA